MTHTARQPFRAFAIAIALTANIPLVACGQTPNDTRAATAGLPDLEQSLTAHEWLLDVDDSSLTGAGANPVTLAFAGASAASGTAPCNIYRGVVTLDGDDGVRVHDLATTLTSCEPEVMTTEDEYLDALAQVQTADVTDRDRLVLTSDDVRLSFTAIDADVLVVGDWALTGVRVDGAVQSMIVGTEPIARYGADQSLVVETGCNTLRTTWAIDGRAMTVEQPASTSMSCTEPAGVMDQEAAISSALTDVSFIEVTPAVLTLLDDAGDIVLVARRA